MRAETEKSLTYLFIISSVSTPKASTNQAHNLQYRLQFGNDMAKLFPCEHLFSAMKFVLRDLLDWTRERQVASCDGGTRKYSS